ncbi:unnamed protein product [Ectocarpus sp. 12 AP-2014]
MSFFMFSSRSWWRRSLAHLMAHWYTQVTMFGAYTFTLTGADESSSKICTVQGAICRHSFVSPASSKHSRIRYITYSRKQEMDRISVRWLTTEVKQSAVYWRTNALVSRTERLRAATTHHSSSET